MPTSRPSPRVRAAFAGGASENGGGDGGRDRWKPARRGDPSGVTAGAGSGMEKARAWGDSVSSASSIVIERTRSSAVDRSLESTRARAGGLGGAPPAPQPLCSPACTVQRVGPTAAASSETREQAPADRRRSCAAPWAKVHWAPSGQAPVASKALHNFVRHRSLLGFLWLPEPRWLRFGTPRSSVSARAASAPGDSARSVSRRDRLSRRRRRARVTWLGILPFFGLDTTRFFWPASALRREFGAERFRERGCC